MNLNDKQLKVFKLDPITIAVDKCNEILKELDICVGSVAYVNKDAWTSHAGEDYMTLENKLMLKNTRNEILKLEKE
jgi:histidinol phosphatase-like PHP family hydrolase